MAESSGIVGTDGRPLRRSETGALGRPFALPTLTGVRQLWDASSVASGLDPQTLATILQEADRGEGRAYLKLAMEMEQREAHYRSVLSTRKRAVTRLPITVESASDAPEDVELADEIRRMVKAPGFRGMLAHALDGLGKGYAAIEIRWDTSRTPWMPRDRIDPATGELVKGYQWIDPRWFRYDRAGGRTLRLLDDADPLEGIPLPPHRYLVHEPELMSGPPLGRGLARVACVSYMAKSYTLKDWLAFSEIYGMPIRVGKYGPSATDEDIFTLVTAISNIGTDAGAAIPDSMQIEFVEASKSSSSEVFSTLATWADKQISKAVLGQTASADGTAGALGAQQAQDGVRDDLRDADAEELADTLNRDLVAHYLALNYGKVDPEASPAIVMRARDIEDIGALTTALAALIPLGLRVESSIIRDKLGLPDPPEGPDVELLGGAPPAPDQPGAPLPATNRASLNRIDPTKPDHVDRNTDRLGRAAEPLVAAMLSLVRKEMNSAADLATLQDRLLTLYPELDGQDMAALMGDAFVATELAGRFEAAAPENA